MSSYLVLEKPARGAAEADFVVLRDRFSWLAFLFPLLWALFNRLWIEALGILALTLVLGVLGETTLLASVAPFLALAFMLLFGLEASTIRAMALRRRGYADWGVVEADNSADAEIRYLAERYGDAAEPVRAPAMTMGRPAHGHTAPALGLFGYGSGR